MIPSTPIFGLEEVDPFPVPKRPSSTQERPSTNIPLHSKLSPHLDQHSQTDSHYTLKKSDITENTAIEDLPINGMDGGWRGT